MPDYDYLLDAVHKHWCNILKTYRLYDKKKPIILLDIQQQRIYVYPFVGFRDEMNEDARHSLTEQYEKAVKENKLVVFVRDNDQKRLVSYSMPMG